MATQSESFEKTVKFCQISLTDLAAESGVSRSYLTEFKKGKGNPTVEVVERILTVMESKRSGARAFFYLNCAGESPTLSDRIHQLSIDSPTDRKEAADALRLIVSKFIPDDNNSENQSKIRENTEELAQVR